MLKSELKRVLNLEEKILAGAYDAIFRINRDSEILYANKAAHSVFGYEPEELIGKNVSVLMSTHHAISHAKYVDGSHKNSDDFKINNLSRLRAKKKNGELFPIDIHINNVSLDGEDNFIGFIRDVSDIVDKEESLHRFLYYDAITNSPNSKALERFLKAVFDSEEIDPLRFLVVGIDSVPTRGV